MKYLIIFAAIFIFTEIYAEDSICKENQRLVNPRECCPDPNLITNEIFEKCRIQTDHMLEPNSYENTEQPVQLQNREYENEEIESKLSVKPLILGDVGNEVKRDRKPSNRQNPFDLNEYGDSDEKLFVRNVRSTDYNSASTSNSREESNPKVGHKHKNHHRRTKCHDNEEYHKHHDPTLDETDSSDDDNSGLEHKKHHRRHRHHCRHNRHHKKHHHRRHHCRDSKYHKQERLGHQFNKFSCFMECVFNETGIIENKTVSMINVHKYLTEVLELNDEYLPTVTDAFKICGKQVADLRQKIKELPVIPMMPMISFMPHRGYKINSQKCKPWAGYLMMCIKAQTFINCPADNFRNDNIRCNNTREFMKACPKQSARIPYDFSNMGRRFSKH